MLLTGTKFTFTTLLLLLQSSLQPLLQSLHGLHSTQGGEFDSGVSDEIGLFGDFGDLGDFGLFGDFGDLGDFVLGVFGDLGLFGDYNWFSGLFHKNDYFEPFLKTCL